MKWLVLCQRGSWKALKLLDTVGKNWTNLCIRTNGNQNINLAIMEIPIGVKWSARMYIEEAVANGAKLINGAKVKKVLFEGNKAVGVEFTKGQKKYEAFAPKVVISAGGIGTPVILRASGIKRAGYDFFFDPLIGVRGTVKDIDVPTSEIPMTAGVHIEDEGYMMTDMAHPFATTAMFAAGSF